MNNELELRNKIEDLQTDLDDKVGHLSYLDKLLGASKWLTFLLYLAFALALYVGDVWHLQTLLTSFMGGAFGIVFFGVIALLLAYVLAGTKHAAYTHFSMFKTVKLVLLVAVFTGIMAEVFNSSGVQDVKARAITSTDKEYNSLVQSSTESNVNVSPALAHSIAAAEQRLARCRENLVNGKEKHCKGDAAKAAGLKASQGAALNAQVAASSATQSERFKRMDELKNEAYNPVIKSLSTTLAIDMATAIALMMLIFAIVFECMHYYLSVMRRDTLLAIRDIRKALRRAEAEYFEFMGFEYGSNQEAAPEVPQPKVAQPNRFKYQMAPAVGVGVGIGDDGISTGVGAGVIAAPKALLDNNPVPETKNPFGFAPSPKAKLPAKAMPGRTGENNPVLGRSEQHYELPLSDGGQLQPESVSKPSAEGLPSKPAQTLSTPSAEGQKSGLYEDWIKAVNSGECKPSVRPTWLFIQKRIAPKETGSRTHDRTRITSMQKAFFSRAVADGYMIKNPNYKNGMKKFIWSVK